MPVPQCVVLIHGLGWTKLYMTVIEAYLRAVGFRVVNLSYPPRGRAIREIADCYVDAEVRRQSATGERCSGQCSLKGWRGG